jgi:hypothetical protein
MKVIIINRKRLGVTVIIIGLMLVLFGFEQKFDVRLKYVALMQSNINSLKKYDVPELKFSYKLPSEWATKKQSFQGDEIVYHNDFFSEDATIHGFVQVWNKKEDLKSFLEKSKNLNQQYAEYTDYSMVPVEIKNQSGYLTIYTMKNLDGTKFKGYEYFLNNNNRIYRFSFFVRDVNFKENMPTIFKTIVENFEHKE